MEKGVTVRKPILCLDFDGVVHSYVSGWKGADVIPDPPVAGAFKFIRKAIRGGFDVQVFSSRSNLPGGIPAMQKWFIDHNWAGTYLTGCVGITFPLEKPPAMVTLDDRAITFEGEWPKIKDLKAFQPWTLKK